MNSLQLVDLATLAYIRIAPSRFIFAVCTRTTLDFIPKKLPGCCLLDLCTCITSDCLSIFYAYTHWIGGNSDITI